MTEVHIFRGEVVGVLRVPVDWEALMAYMGERLTDGHWIGGPGLPPVEAPKKEEPKKGKRLARR